MCNLSLAGLPLTDILFCCAFLCELCCGDSVYVKVKCNIELRNSVQSGIASRQKLNGMYIYNFQIKETLIWLNGVRSAYSEVMYIYRYS